MFTSTTTVITTEAVTMHICEARMKFPDFSIFYNRKNEIFADQWGGQRGWRDDFDLKGLMYDNLCYSTHQEQEEHGEGDEDVDA